MDFRRMNSAHYKTWKLTEMDFWNNKSRIYCFDEKKRKNIHGFLCEKWWENYNFDFPSKTEIQTVLLCLQARTSEIARGFNLARSEIINQRPENENSGIMLLKFKYGKFYFNFLTIMIWTVTDVMLRERKISDNSKFGEDYPFWVKVRVNRIMEGATSSGKRN